MKEIDKNIEENQKPRTCHEISCGFFFYGYVLGKSKIKLSKSEISNLGVSLKDIYNTGAMVVREYLKGMCPTCLKISNGFKFCKFYGNKITSI